MEDLVTVMIADDEAVIRNGLAEIVSAVEFKTRVIASAADGEEALYLLEQQRPDIAIIDINMPKFDGLAVIRKATEANWRTCFLILSGYNDFSYAQQAIRYGVKHYFLKPLNIAEFKTEFGRHCEEIRTQRSATPLITPQKLTSLLYSSKIFWLNQLIENKVEWEENIQGKLRDLQLSFSYHQPCFVVVFKLSTYAENSLAILSSLHTDIVTNYFKDYTMESWVYDQTKIIAVFGLEDTADKLWRQQLDRCVEHLNTHTPYHMAAGIGSVTESLTVVSQSYLLALEALSYHIYSVNGNIYDTGIICRQKPGFSHEAVDYKPLIYYITKGNQEGITNYCNVFLQSLFFIPMPPPNFLMGMCMYLLMNVQKQLILLYPEARLNIEFTYQEINSLSSVSALKEWLIDFFSRCSEVLNAYPGQDNSIIKASKEFITNNLSRNIKARDVALHVNLSEAYFSIYFKDKTGINFRDYLIKARIDLAKNLLQQQDANISEIAYLTGYQDYRSFSRAFKNETGLSPSEYNISPKAP